MKTLYKLFALVVSMAALAGTAWAVEPEDLAASAESAPASYYESHFNQVELENQF